MLKNARWLFYTSFLVIWHTWTVHRILVLLIKISIQQQDGPFDSNMTTTVYTSQRWWLFIVCTPPKNSRAHKKCMFWQRRSRKNTRKWDKMSEKIRSFISKTCHKNSLQILHYIMPSQGTVVCIHLLSTVPKKIWIMDKNGQIV